MPGLNLHDYQMKPTRLPPVLEHTETASTVLVSIWYRAISATRHRAVGDRRVSPSLHPAARRLPGRGGFGGCLLQRNSDGVGDAGGIEFALRRGEYVIIDINQTSGLRPLPHENVHRRSKYLPRRYDLESCGRLDSIVAPTSTPCTRGRDRQTLRTRLNLGLV
jgi:hypothetical protein